MKKNLIRLACLVLVLMAGMMAVASAAEGYFYVKTGNGKTLNLRTDPWKADNVVTKLPYGAYVLVYQYNDNGTWAYIECDNPYGGGTVKGWVQTSFLVPYYPGSYNPPAPTPVPAPTVTTIDDINRAAKAIKTLDVPYTTVIQTKKATNYVHLRMFPDTNAVYSGAYLCDTPIEVLAESRTWAQVRVLDDGKVGFILKTCVSPVY